MSPSTTSPPEFPEREREEIRLDGLNPCEVWSVEQRRELGVRDEPSRGDPSPNVLGEMTCSYYAPFDAEIEISYLITVSEDADVTTMYGDDTSRITETIVTVAGFPAVQDAAPEGSRPACALRVGTAEGQALSISFAPLPNELSVEQACAQVTEAVEMAIETLDQR